MGSQLSITSMSDHRKDPSELSTRVPAQFCIPKTYKPSDRRVSTTMIGKIDTKIYSQTFDYRELPPPHNPSPLGTLSFEVHYESYEQQLTIRLIAAKRLPVRHHVTEPGETSEYDPIACNVKVLVCLLPGQKKILESSIKEGTRDPVFDEVFVFNISKQELRESTVRLSVFDCKRYHKLCPIGHALYNLKTQDLDGTTLAEREIKLQSQTNGHSIGQVYLSLKYLPSYGRVVIKIMQARDILHFDKICFKEYYVKVCHILSDRKLKTKRTSTAEGKRNMLFDCEFSFDIAVGDLSESCLVVSLVNHAMVRRSRTVGRIILGPYLMEAEGERRHWGKMIAAPNTFVNQWHSLYL